MHGIIPVHYQLMHALLFIWYISTVIIYHLECIAVFQQTFKSFISCSWLIYLWYFTFKKRATLHYCLFHVFLIFNLTGLLKHLQVLGGKVQSQMVKNKSCSLVPVSSVMFLKIQYFNWTTDHQILGWKTSTAEKIYWREIKCIQYTKI